MKKYLKVCRLFAMVGVLVIGLGASAHALDLSLVDQLTKTLGVSKTQASGGAGAIFDAASKTMSAEDFGKVTSALPEVKSLLNAAPKPDKESGGLGSLGSMLGDSGGTLSSLSNLKDTFSKLGLNSDMIVKFLPIIMSYAQSKGGNGVSGLLTSAFDKIGI